MLLDLRQTIASSATGALTALCVLLLVEMLRRRGEQPEPVDAAPRRRASNARRASGPPFEPRLLRANSDSSALFKDKIEVPGELRRASTDSPTLDPASSIFVANHTEDATLRLPNPYLMQRGRAVDPRTAHKLSPSSTAVVRIALTGGPCAGKSSALDHLTRTATAEGFDVLTCARLCVTGRHAARYRWSVASMRCAQGARSGDSLLQCLVPAAHTQREQLRRQPLHVPKEHYEAAAAGTHLVASDRTSVASHRIASHRIASRRIASHQPPRSISRLATAAASPQPLPRHSRCLAGEHADRRAPWRAGSASVPRSR
jgi:hypothetical protein